MKYKYIRFRASRKKWEVKISVKNKSITRYAVLLDDAIAIRAQMVREYNIDPKRIVDVPETGEDMAALEDSGPNNGYLTLAEGYEQWFRNVIFIRVRQSTQESYKHSLNMITAAGLGKIRINNVTPEVMQRKMIEYQRQHNRTKDYMAGVLNKLKRYYDYELKHDLKYIMDDNPCNNIMLDEIHRPKKRAFTDEELSRFFVGCHSYDHEYGTQCALLFELYLQTGCRRGELVSLKFKDINWKESLVSINTTVKRNFKERKWERGLTKTPTGVRSFPVSLSTMGMLRLRYRVVGKNDEELIFKHGMVCTLHKNKITDLKQIDSVFRVIRRKIGLPEELTLHCLRHTMASKMIQAGVDLATIQDVGGWRNSRVLLSVYAHSSVSKMREGLSKSVW